MRAGRYAASWLLPIAGPPIENGAVLVDGDGRIAALGPDDHVPRPPGVAEHQFPGSALLPGFINTHTHLELTGLDGQVPDDDFPAWIRRIIALKLRRTPEDFLAAARQGLRDCWTAGVTTVADTGDSGAVIQALAEVDGSGIAYHEVFGPHPDQMESAIAGARRRLTELGRFQTGRIRLGLSPHAPYSVSGPLYTAVAGLASELGMPLAVHLAESREETALLQSGSGGFADAWIARGIPLPAMPGRSPVAWLDQHGVLGPETLCIHVVQASDADLGTLSGRGAAVAHCPRSNRRHGHGRAPLRAMLDHGLRVGLGTDSVASVAPLDLLAEARAAREIAGLSAAATLELVTLGAARALGLAEQIGSLTPGKWADLVSIELPGAVDVGQLADTLLTLPREAIGLVLLAGRQVHRRGVVPA